MKFIRGPVPREDWINEHSGVESHAPIAQTDVAGFVVLSYGCSLPRLATLNIYLK
jgi:hypothetical protein